MTEDYPGVLVENFAASWADGLALCALMHRFFPDEINFEEMRSKTIEGLILLLPLASPSLKDSWFSLKYRAGVEKLRGHGKP